MANSGIQIEDGLATFQPVCFYRGRNGDLFWVNGLDRPRRWDSLTTDAELAGLAAPVLGSFLVTLAAGGNATAGEYTIAIQYIDDTIPDPVQSSISEVYTITAADGDKFNYSSIPVPSEVRATSKRIWRSTSGQSDTLYLVTTLAAASTSSPNDTLSDDDLTENETLPILLPNGDLNARRFGVPPDDKPYAVVFQDRVFMAGRVAYSEGTVTTNGDTSLVGAGTAWTDEMEGRYVYIYGEPAPLVIDTVNSATSITLDDAATTSTAGSSYQIIPSPDKRNEIAYSEDSEPESMPDTNILTLQDNTGDEDEITGLMPFGAFLYVLKERHIYSLKFIRQPKIDVAINCIAWRGCLNHRCWDILDGVAYVMDQTGIYAFAQGQVTPIDAPIQDQFWDGTIDFSVAKWFWVKADTQRKLVYFAVSYAEDDSTRPMRALVYNTVSQTWMPDKYVWELGGAVVVPISGTARFVMGSESDKILAAGEGTSDLVDAVTGTATGATSTTLSDSSASFDDDMVDAPLAIIAGTGSGQLRRITTVSTNQLTVSEVWDTTPSTDSQYLVGAIEWSHKTGQLEFPVTPQRYTRRLFLSMMPTDHTALVTVTHFKNKYQDERTQHINEDRGTGVTAAKGGDHTFDISRYRTPLDETSSMLNVALPGFVDERSNAQRWMAVEFSGFQGLDAITLDTFEIVGVEQ